MHLALPSINPIANAVSQVMTSFASRASTAAQNFESDLQAGNVSGAQSFLSALQQKLSAGNTGSATTGLSSQFAQVQSDLTTGNLAGAESDFSSLEQAMSQLKHGTGPQSAGTAWPPQNNLAGAKTTAPWMDPSYLLQQSAYNSALNLSMPASLPGFSANF